MFDTFQKWRRLEDERGSEKLRNQDAKDTYLLHGRLMVEWYVELGVIIATRVKRVTSNLNCKEKYTVIHDLLWFIVLGYTLN